MAHATAAEVLQALRDLDYPASKEAIVACAENAGAPDGVLRAVRALALADYANKDEVVRSLDLDPAPRRSASDKNDAARDRDKRGIAESARGRSGEPVR